MIPFNLVSCLKSTECANIYCNVWRIKLLKHKGSLPKPEICSVLFFCSVKTFITFTKLCRFSDKKPGNNMQQECRLTE